MSEFDDNFEIDEIKEKKNKKRKKKSHVETYIIRAKLDKESFKAKIYRCIRQIFISERENIKDKVVMLSEKEIILKLIARCEIAHEYLIKHDKKIITFRFLIYKLAKSGYLVKVKIYGDDKHVYYILPDDLPKIKDKIVSKK